MNPWQLTVCDIPLQRPKNAYIYLRSPPKISWEGIREGGQLSMLRLSDRNLRDDRRIQRSLVAMHSPSSVSIIFFDAR